MEITEKKAVGIVLICSRCERRSSGPKKLRGKDVRKAVERGASKAGARLLTQMTGCQGLCPKKAIASMASVGGPPVLQAELRDGDDVSQWTEMLAKRARKGRAVSDVAAQTRSESPAGATPEPPRQAGSLQADSPDPRDQESTAPGGQDYLAAAAAASAEVEEQSGVQLALDSHDQPTQVGGVDLTSASSSSGARQTASRRAGSTPKSLPGPKSDRSRQPAVKTPRGANGAKPIRA